ncbi:hypothetical protein SEA_BIGFOOT_66 [Mycobacterium phage Bigfoot]|nr:hypothetical protein SEA_BIGFOOT_66 [Mycobacterium phage Bigfoot]AOZ64112.1 hypothetical protein SEA_CACTUSROSE_74 [Mycobacterium phage CactusRose]QOC55836.1 hypothetical protein SEA_JORGENSEN_77 [Mycobacterium phage Jorgensen]
MTDQTMSLAEFLGREIVKKWAISSDDNLIRNDDEEET